MTLEMFFAPVRHVDTGHRRDDVLQTYKNNGALG